MIKKIITVLIICGWVTSLTRAQKFDPDSLFIEVREAAFANRWNESRKMCRYLLAHYPEYIDAAIMIARTYAWEHKSDSARILTRQIYAANPKNYELLDLIVDIERWEQKFPVALEQINKAMTAFPDNEHLTYKKAWIQYLMGDYNGAAITLTALFKINPDHRQGQEIRSRIVENIIQNQTR
jgi:predicted Zn-dependent protease